MPPSNFAGVPTYVLFCGDTQLGSAVMGWHGENNVFFIEIFEPHRKKGYGTFFIKKIEEEVKKLGFNFITAYLY
jgi:GNAT superfamily N-acetyltransferase